MKALCPSRYCWVVVVDLDLSASTGSGLGLTSQGFSLP